MHALCVVAFAFAAVPATLFCWNLYLYRLGKHPAPETSYSVSILIPARNEERSIAQAVHAALLSRHVDLEVLVFDDSSEDETAAIVRSISKRDTRVRLLPGRALPEGWCGKQFACFELAQCAARPILCFQDADVRLNPDGLWRIIAAMRDASLISGFPCQETVTFLERLLLPLMHYILLGFLPIAGMRLTTHPAFAAGCGQLMIARRDAYFHAGGHAAIRTSRHDGITLPRAFRVAGLRTELIDATDAAVCRMYRSAAEVLAGLLKNANEGMATPARIVPFTVTLLAGQVLPFVVLPFLWPEPVLRAWLIGAIACALLPRLLAAIRFRQPLDTALLHPFSITALLALQWRALLGASVPWKGRHPSGISEPVPPHDLSRKIRPGQPSGGLS